MTDEIKPVLITNPMPDFMFRDPEDMSEEEVQGFVDWADDEYNQGPDNLAKAGLYHPIVRQRWIDFGLIKIEHIQYKGDGNVS